MVMKMTNEEWESIYSSMHDQLSAAIEKMNSLSYCKTTASLIQESHVHTIEKLLAKIGKLELLISKLQVEIRSLNAEIKSTKGGNHTICKFF